MEGAMMLLPFLFCAGLCDLRTGRIPNWLAACGAVTGLFFCGGPGEAAGRLLSAGAAVAIGALKLAGAGDVKLWAASALLAGALPACCVFLGAAGLMAAAAAAERKGELAAAAASLRRSFLAGRLERPGAGKERPFAPFMFFSCAGCMAVQCAAALGAPA